MATKSARLKKKRARRGRPRDETALRTASGRKSRARRPQEDPRRVALEARRRVLGLPEKLAGHEKAATVLGRLWLAGDIGAVEREAGERYLEVFSDAMRALKAPMGLAVTGGAGSSGDQISEDYVAWAVRAAARYKVLKSALEGIGATTIVHAVAVEDQSPPRMSLPALIAGLKLLAIRLGLA